MRLIPRALLSFARSIGNAITTARNPRDNHVEARYTPALKPITTPWSTPWFTRWRSNPNWPGRRAAAARRTAGKTRRMR